MARRWTARLGILLTLCTYLSVSSAGSAHATDPLLPGEASTYNAVCGDFRPTSGSFLATRAGSEFRVTWNFRMSPSAKAALDCVASTFGQDWLELDLVLTGFAGINDWDGYDLDSTNIPGAVHDAAWMDAAANATPAVTGIPVSALQADTSYYFGIRWNTTTQFYPVTGQTQRVSFQWVPSHWADPLNAGEGPACYAGLGRAAWCIFPGGVAYISGKYYTYFQPPARDGIPFGNPLSPMRPFPPTGALPGDPGGGSGSDGDGGGGSGPSAISRQMFLRGDKAVFAKAWVGEGGWQMQVGPANAIAIAADNTGIQAFIRWDGAVFAKRNHLGDGGWQMQAGPGNADAIAAGGGVLMFLRGDKAIFAKTNIGIDGGWTQQAGPGTVTAIAMGNYGRMMVRSNTNAIYAKDNLVNGAWNLQVGDGNAEAIAVG